MILPPPPALHHPCPSRGTETETQISAIKALCVERGLKLTASRLRVLRILAASGSPMKAYSILDEMRKDAPGTAPPAVYRALDFLLAQGWVVRLNAINAFLVRPPAAAGACTYLICENCGTVDALHGPVAHRELLSSTRIAGFTPTSNTLEITGICYRCNAGDA